MVDCVYNLLFVIENIGGNLYFHYDVGTRELLQRMSDKQGENMKTRDSAKNIPNFIDFF